MAYNELIKNFERIRDYMRQFYVYGFRSRTEYDKKSARSYDNERRRVESWLGDYMRFRQTPEGKNVFLSVDSRAIPGNPLYSAFKAKSFTNGDIIFHFYILDLLRSGEACTAQEIIDAFCDNYLSWFEDSSFYPDISTIRKKLKEYVNLGILKTEKKGRELRFLRNDSEIALTQWRDTLDFFSEANPLGVVGSFLLDKLEDAERIFRFKHHYILHALDSQILLQLLSAMEQHRWVELTNSSPAGREEVVHKVFPVKIHISTQGGRQYLMGYHAGFHKLMFFRLDNIHAVKSGDPEPDWERLEQQYRTFCAFLWGASAGNGKTTHHLEMTVCYGEKENFIPQRLEREKRNGRVEHPEAGICRYIVDVYDAQELLPWLRTFIGRIVELKCTDEAVTKRFFEDLTAMNDLYGGNADAVQ